MELTLHPIWMNHFLNVVRFCHTYGGKMLDGLIDFINQTAGLADVVLNDDL